MTNRIAQMLGQTEMQTTRIQPDDPPEMRLLKKHIWTLCAMTHHENVDHIQQCVGLLGITPDGKKSDAIMFIHITEPHEPADSKKAMSYCGREARRMFARLDAACLVSEAWSVSTDNPWAEVKPRNSPKRQESVTVQCETPQGVKLTTRAAIRRRHDGTIEPLQFFEPNSQTMIECDGLMAAFWEGYRRDADEE
jgi:hypothetical protein